MNFYFVTVTIFLYFRPIRLFKVSKDTKISLITCQKTNKYTWMVIIVCNQSDSMILLPFSISLIVTFTAIEGKSGSINSGHSIKQ